MNNKKRRLGLLSFSADGSVALKTVLEGSGFRYNLTEDELKSYSMWGASSDQNKYFSDEDANTIIPKDEDFLNIPFRLLSATIVGAYSWKATDFSDVKMLKKATKLLSGKPIYKDHDMDSVDNVVGIVGKTTFTDGYLDGKIKVPSGIDGILRIDAKTNPKLARNVYIGAVNSNSVTVLFDWIPSHDFEDDWEFEKNIGKVIEGKMVTRKVTKILDFYETSLVWLGADPYSKKRNEDGKLDSVDVTHTFEDEDDSVKNSYKNESFYKISCSVEKDLLNCTPKCSLNSTSFNKNNKGMSHIEKTLVSLFGVSAIADITPEMMQTINKEGNTDKDFITSLVKSFAVDDRNAIESYVTSLKDGKEKAVKDLENKISEVTNLNLEKVSLTDKLDKATKDLETLQTKYDERESLAKLGNKFIFDKREETKRLYSLSIDGKTSEAILDIIKEADNSVLDGLLSQYTKNMEKKFTATCKDCNSHNIVMRSTFVEETEETEETDNGELSLDEIRLKYRK